jgi:phosphatidylserine/phosphatidylglycerophosphate/cardiolipin synthase-like enzyme
LNRVIVELIASAQQQLTICTPYFNLPLPMIREINRALARGVKIDIVVGDKTANDFYIPPSEPFKVIGAAVPVRNQPAPLRQASSAQHRQRPVEPAPVA